MPASASWGEIDRLRETGKERLPDHSGKVPYPEMLRPGCFDTTDPHSAFADGGACRRATRPATPRALGQPAGPAAAYVPA